MTSLPPSARRLRDALIRPDRRPNPGEAPGGFRAAALGAALAKFAASPAARAIAKTAHFLDSGRVIDDFARGGCFLLAEAFGRWAGPAAEMLAIWHFDEYGAYPEMEHVVARIGAAHFDASGSRTAERLLADWTAAQGEGAWLGPFSWQDAETDGVSCEAGPLDRLQAALRKALGRPGDWGLPDARATDPRWTKVRVVAPGGRADVLARLPQAGVPPQSVSVSGEGVEFDVRTGAAAGLLRALRALPEAAPVIAQPRETHTPGGRLPTRYRPRGDDGEPSDDDAPGPADRRLNPEEAPWVLQRRHAEGGRWFEVDRLWSREGAADWVIGPTTDFGHGDLLRLISPDGRVAGFWVKASRGLVDPGPTAPPLRSYIWSDQDWERAWESTAAPASTLVGVARASGVDRRRLALAAADLAETALEVVPVRPEASEALAASRATLEAVRDWALRGAPWGAVSRAAASLGPTLAAGRRPLRPTAFESAVEAVQHAAFSVQAPLAHDPDEGLDHPGSAAQQAAVSVQRVATRDRLDPPSLREIVRRWIPLPILLLSRAGEGTPPDLLL